MEKKSKTSGVALVALAGTLIVGGSALMVFGGGSEPEAPKPAQQAVAKPDAPKPDAAPAAKADAPAKPPEPLVGSTMAVDKSGLKYGLVVRLFGHALEFGGDDKHSGQALTHTAPLGAPRVEVQRLVAQDGAIDMTSAPVGPPGSKLTFAVDAVADGLIWIDKDNDYRLDVGQVFPNGAIASLGERALHRMRSEPWLRQLTVEVDGSKVHEIEVKNDVGVLPFGKTVSERNAVSAIRPIALKPGAHRVRITGTYTMDFVPVFPALSQFSVVSLGGYSDIDRALSGEPNWSNERNDPQTFVLRISDSKTGAMTPVPRDRLFHFPADEPKAQKPAPRSTGDLLAWREYPLDVKVKRWELTPDTSLDLENNAVGRPDAQRSSSASITPELPGSLSVAESDFTPAETGNYVFGVTLQRNYKMAGMSGQMPNYSTDDKGVPTSTGACGARIEIVEDGVPKTMMSRWYDHSQPGIGMPGNLHGSLTAIGQRRFQAGHTYRIVRRMMCEAAALPPTWLLWEKAPSDTTLRAPNDTEWKAPVE